MNLKKFYFLLCGVLSITLFSVGLIIILDTNFNDVIVNAHSDLPVNPLKELLKPNDAEKGQTNKNKKIIKTYTCLLLGGDEVAGNTDTMILANYDPENIKLSLMSIPRDTQLTQEGDKMLQDAAKEKGYGRIIDKINSAYPINGGELALMCVSDLLGIEVNNYVYIDTKVFREIIDLLDGVDYYIPVDLDYDDPLQDLHIHLKKGQQVLDGKAAEDFMRFRQPNEYTEEILKYYDGSDSKRIAAQQNFIKEFIRQKVNFTYFTKVKDVIDVAFSNLKTNVKLVDILPLSLNAYKLDLSKVTITKLPGKAVEEELWYYKHDPVETKKILDELFKPEIIIEDNNNNNNKVAQ